MRNIRRNKRLIRKYGYAKVKIRMYRPGVFYKKIAFEFDPFDDDDFPTVPHGDSYNHHYKLDLISGDVWEKRDRIIGHIDSKEFQKLKQDRKIHELIIKAQAYYREHHPGISINPIPWCEKNIAKKKYSISKKTEKPVYILNVRMGGGDGDS